MKNFSKLLAVVLCMIMVIAALPMTVAFAENTALCQVDTVYSVFVMDDEDVVSFDFTPQQSAYYSLRSYGYEDTYVDVYDEEYNIVASDDDSGKEYNFVCNVYLEAGKTYYFDMGAYFAYESEFDFVLTNLSALDVATIDGASPDVASVNSENVSDFYEFTATADGYYAFSSSTDEVDTYLFAYDSDWSLLNKNDDGGVLYNGCVNVYLSEGESCFFEATTYSDSLECEFEVSVNKTEVVTDIEIVSAPNYAPLYEGYVDDMIDLSDFELRFTYSDSSVLDYIYDEDTEIIGTTLYFDWDVDDDGNYYMYVMTDFASAEIPFEVVENPVESISVNDEVVVELFENLGGYAEEDGFYYVYDLPENLVIDVVFKDGTSATVDYASGVMGHRFDFYDYQDYGERFEVGNNTAYIEYFGVICPINIYVNELPSVLGDVDCDGEISVMDATDIQRYCALKLELSDAQLKLADTDKDKEVSVMDATRIQRLLAKKITEL